VSWPQPHEGVTGVDRDDWLLSLDERAVAHRECLIVMARHLHAATLVGQPAPVVRRMCDRLRQPQPGDLVVTVEVMHGRPDPDSRLKGLGVFLAARREWACTDEQWAAELADYPGAGEDGRATDDVFYIQYGPAARDVCRWHNSAAVVLPVHLPSFAAPAGCPGPDGAVTFTRESLVGGLADSGFRLRGLGPELDPPGAAGQLVTIRLTGSIAEIESVLTPEPADGTIR
jgi:hypothetical protein